MPALRRLMAEFQVAVRAGSAAVHRRRGRLHRLRRLAGLRAGAARTPGHRRRRRARHPGADAEDDAGFMLFDTVLAFDHVKHRILIIANARITADEDLQRALPVRVREDPVPRARARARPVAARARRAAGARRALQQDAGGLRSRRAHDQGTHRRGRHLPGGAVAALRGRRHGRSVHRLSRAAPRQPVAVHVFHPDGRRWRSSDRRRRCSCASKDAASRRTRSPARARAGRTTRRTSGWPRS